MAARYLLCCLYDRVAKSTKETPQGMRHSVRLGSGKVWPSHARNRQSRSTRMLSLFSTKQCVEETQGPHDTSSSGS